MITAGKISTHGEINWAKPVKRTQVWEVGETVKVGFLTLRITVKEQETNSYLLTNKDGSKTYRFVPHFGLERIK